MTFFTSTTKHIPNDIYNKTILLTLLTRDDLVEEIAKRCWIFFRENDFFDMKGRLKCIIISFGDKKMETFM